MKGTYSSLSNSLKGKHTAFNCKYAGSNPASKNRALNHRRQQQQILGFGSFSGNPDLVSASSFNTEDRLFS